MRWTTTIILFVMGFGLCSAQGKEQIVITGRVADMDNFPLINATIFNTNTKNGTTTDKHGIFHLTLPKKTTTINISYVGFHTLKKEITTVDLENSENDTLLFSFLLKPKVMSLTEFEINASNTQLAYNKPSIIVIDYDFHEDGLYLLLSINRQYKLRSVDDNSNVLSDLTIRKKPERLFRDCFGILHVVYRDSVYQIYEANAELNLMNGISIEKFNNFLLPCVTACNEKLFLKYYGIHNQSVIYYLIAKGSKQRRLVQEIIDKEQLIRVDDYYQETLAESAFAVNVMGDINYKQLDFARKVEQNVLYYQFILSRPIYNPLFRTRDSIFIFNHVVDSAFVYNQHGTLQRTFPITYHHKRGWKNEIIIDFSKNEIYAKCLRSGLVYLLQIDPNNGQILNEIKLDSHLFPDKIKIRDGFAYYLYNDKKGFSVQNVYKQKLK